ncbi:MAG: hypothetical protein ACOYMB_01620 [Patescibacteria group bacterium]
MKNISPEKRAITIFLIIFVFSFIAISYVRAENDNEDEYENEGRRPAVPVYQVPAPVVSLTQVEPAKVVSPSSSGVKTITKTSLIDSDQDGILDKFDKFPGEDDFAFYLKDSNTNGIADDLEELFK